MENSFLYSEGVKMKTAKPFFFSALHFPVDSFHNGGRKDFGTQLAGTNRKRVASVVPRLNNWGGPFVSGRDCFQLLTRVE